jgi:hypothetical protein
MCNGFLKNQAKIRMKIRRSVIPWKAWENFEKHIRMMGRICLESKQFHLRNSLLPMSVPIAVDDAYCPGFRLYDPATLRTP